VGFYFPTQRTSLSIKTLAQDSWNGAQKTTFLRTLAYGWPIYLWINYEKLREYGCFWICYLWQPMWDFNAELPLGGDHLFKVWSKHLPWEDKEEKQTRIIVHPFELPPKSTWPPLGVVEPPKEHKITYNWYWSLRCWKPWRCWPTRQANSEFRWSDSMIFSPFN
jgi:hypothetical protein